MSKASISELVRKYAVEVYIEPARRRGESKVRIVAGDVHKALHLTGRVPSVCQALTSAGFLREHALQLETSSGPPSGLSTTMTYTYRLQGDRPADAESRFAALRGLRGIGRSVFESLGGGEAFLRREREQFRDEDRGATKSERKEAR